MRDWTFNVVRLLVRSAYSIPGRVRQLWRTLLVWGRVSRVYHESGMQGLKRWRSVRGVSKDNLRRKVSRGKDSNQTPFPPYRG